VTAAGRKVPPRPQIGNLAGLLAAALLAVAPAAVALLGAACSGVAEDKEVPPPPAPPRVDPFEDTGVQSLEFLDGQALTQSLTVIAGTPREIVVRVDPPGEHTTRFALVGSAQDAFLSDDIALTDPEDGIARTELTVLSASPSFGVRAAVGKLSLVLHLVALEAELGTLVLNPVYPGHRKITNWVASVHFNQTCANLLGPPFPEGDNRTSAPGDGVDDSVQIDNVHANTPLAAVINADHFAGGCRSIRPLKVGSNTITEIDTVDRPLQLGQLNLRLSLRVDTTAELNPGLDELAFRAVQPLNGTAANDLAALLDAMSGLADDSVAFEQARSEQDWVGVLVAALPPAAPGTGLRTLVHGWMSTGLAQLSSPDAIVGTLTSPNAAGQATFQLTSIASFTPASVGFTVANLALVSAETDDLLRVGTTLSWQPTPFLVAAAERVAISESPGSRQSAAEGMAEDFDCANVSSLLVDAGATPGEAFPDCDEACMLTLCDGAMGVLWSRVTASNLPSVPWQISAASQAQIDADARPTTLVDGNWVGSLTLSNFGDAPIQGLCAGRSSAN